MDRCRFQLAAVSGFLRRTIKSNDHPTLPPRRSAAARLHRQPRKHAAVASAPGSPWCGGTLPLLRGHGASSPQALIGVTWADWLADGAAALAENCTRVDRVILVGHNMGALGPWRHRLHLGADGGPALIAGLRVSHQPAAAPDIHPRPDPAEPWRSNLARCQRINPVERPWHPSI